MTLAPGTELGHYEILSAVGAGGMGEVYRARDSRLGREVAIKVLSADRTGSAADRKRFEQEARAVALLSHPNILAIHEFDTDHGVSFAVTELLTGETLAQRIRRSALPWTEAVAIAAAICDGLAAAHAKGVIHRDLKPANVFLTSDDHVKILDFGLARMPAGSRDNTTELRTEPGTVMGTIGYTSPEQLRGEQAGPGTDIFALGCILYEMMAGVSPFARATASEINAAILRDEAAALPGVPPALNGVIRRSLAKNPADRYHSAHDFALELRSLARPTPDSRRRRAAFAAIAAVAMAIVAAVIVFVRRPAAPPARDGIRSILVVPFENATHDASAEYLSDGIAEGLINSLAELPNVRIVARTTAFRFKGKPIDLPQIRNQLDVDTVLSGRLVSAANTIVVQADLVDAVGGNELWGDRFHERSANVFNIEQRIVDRIGDALRVRLTRTRASTQNPEASRLYLQGRFYWNKRNPEAIRKAKELFEQATVADPRFALAYCGLADAYNMLGGTYRAMPHDEGFRRATEAAQTALRLDPDLAEAHASLGLIAANQFRWAPAEREFQRAMTINPSSVNALHWDSLVLGAEGRIDDALAMVRRAEAVDPLSAIMAANVANRLNSRGSFQDALAEAKKATELDPAYVPGYWQAGTALEGLGQRDAAVATYRQAAMHAGVPGMGEGCLMRANVLMNDRAEARRLLDALEQRASRGEIAAMYVAWGYSALGDRDHAIQWLERAFAAREASLRDSVRSPILKELRGDPRYADLLARLARGFEE